MVVSMSSDEGKAEDGAASSRRPAPRLSGTLSALASSSTSSASSSEDWLFVQLADTQLGLYNQNPDTSCSDWAAEAALSRRAVAALNAMRPRPVFAIVCGDLTNAMPNGPTAQPDVCERQRRCGPTGGRRELEYRHSGADQGGEVGEAGLREI